MKFQLTLNSNNLKALVFMFFWGVISILGSYAQMFPNGDFEAGTGIDCDCAEGYFCFEDAGRVIDGVNPVYQVGNQGCATGDGTYALSLGANSGSGYIYFYAGGDQVITPDTFLPVAYKIRLSVMYAGPQGSAASGQNGTACYFTFGLDGNRIGPEIHVPVNTTWTNHSYEFVVFPGLHNFRIRSGDPAKYAIWFDDFIVEVLCEYPSIDLGSDTSICEGETLLLDATYPGATYLWQDNSTLPDFLVTQEGKYWVDVTNDCGTSTDTIYVGYDQLATIDLGNDTLLCPGETLLLDVSLPDATFLWSDNSTDPQLLVTQPGIYWVQVSNQCGSVRDSVTVDYSFSPVADLGNDTALCQGESIILEAGNQGAQYLWQDNSTGSSFLVNAPGNYWLMVSNECGTSIDTIEVNYLDLPQIDLGPDQHVCDGEVIILDAASPQATYYWQDGSNNSSFLVSEEGFYWVEVTNKCGLSKDSVYVMYDLSPEVNLGEDMTLCEGDTLNLNVFISGASYLWQDGSDKSNYMVTDPGSYWVEVSLDGCKESDSLNIWFDNEPHFSYGSDTTLCMNEELILDLSAIDDTCLWQDGSTDPIYRISEEGSYTAKFKNACGEFIFSIQVLYSDCNCHIYLPNSFSPNMDGKNDYFYPVHSCDLQDYRLLVFDRWGNVVFDTESVNDKWDGKYMGKISPAGIYTYVVSYSSTTGNLQEQTGSVIIIR